LVEAAVGRSPADGREHALDGLRGAGAIAVMSYHVFDFFPFYEGARAALLASPLGILFNGLGALHVFFVLSGYVLALSLTHDTRPRKHLRFYVRRVFRIHPPYVAAVLFAWAMTLGLERISSSGAVPLSASASCFHLRASLLPRALMVPSLAFGQLPVGWSLFVELAMSVIFPLLLWLARRTHPLVLVGLGFFLMRPLDSRLGFLVFTLDFALGIAVFLAAPWVGTFVASLSRSATAAWLVATVVLLQAPYAISWWRTGQSGMHARYEPSMIAPLALGAALLVALTVHQPSVRRFFAARWIASLGTISFSFYLIHFTMLAWIVCRFGGRSLGVPAALGMGLVAFALSVGLSILGYRFVEQPAMDAGRAVGRAIAGRSGRAPKKP
jgi:peptidoglycan/LPS O-acetylase OafA/YrhL